jgi:class 3 adenylate cyclase
VLIEANEECPRPSRPALASLAEALQRTNQWGWIFDRDWRILFVTDAQRRSFAADPVAMVPVTIGVHMFGPEYVEQALLWRTGPISMDIMKASIVELGPYLLRDIPGGRAAVQGWVDPRLVQVLDDVEPAPPDHLGWFTFTSGTTLGRHDVLGMVVPIHEATGERVGTLVSYAPAAPMDVLGAMAFERDLDHLTRANSLSLAGRRPAAILFADLEGSSALARTLSAASYFSVVRRIVRAADRAIVDAGGVVGRHVGDGVVAFFPVETSGSESDAVRGCLSAAAAIRAAMARVAERSGLAPEALTVRFGLHWGGTLYMGNVATLARSEVTALGDEVNETARIEASATGGLILASKQLLERLDPSDADAIGLDLDDVSYTLLGELSTATAKARRDAAGVAVTDLSAVL